MPYCKYKIIRLLGREVKKTVTYTQNLDIKKDISHMKKFSKNLQPGYTKVYNNEGEQISSLFVILTNMLSVR
jgi:hypothetical protein